MPLDDEAVKAPPGMPNTYGSRRRRRVTGQPASAAHDKTHPKALMGRVNDEGMFWGMPRLSRPLPCRGDFNPSDGVVVYRHGMTDLGS
jgi:hypothetical protein